MDTYYIYNDLDFFHLTITGKLAIATFFFRRILSSMPDDKNQDSDRQMLIKISRNFAVLFIIIQMYDSLFDWTLGLLDLTLEGFHIIIEAFEYGIEVILEHTLHTNHQQSEIIIVNGTIILGLYFSYKLIRALPRIHNQITTSSLATLV